MRKFAFAAEPPVVPERLVFPAEAGIQYRAWIPINLRNDILS